MNLALVLDSALSQLEANYARAAALLGQTTFFPFLGSKESARSALRVARLSIDFLSGQARSEVLSGSRSLDGWNELAQSTNDNLRTISATIPALSLEKVGGDALAAAAQGALTGFAAGSALVVAGGLVFLALMVRR